PAAVSAKTDVHVVRLSVVEPDADAVVVPGLDAARRPVVDVLLIGRIPAVGACRVAATRIGGFVDRGGDRAALDGKLPGWERVRLDDVPGGVLQLELGRDGASTLEDARVQCLHVSRVV